MALEEIVDSLDGIDEKYKDLYVENANGKFEVNIEGLKSALVKEKVSRKAAEKKLKTAGTTVDPDIDEIKIELKKAQSTINSMKINSVLKSKALSAGVDPDYIDDVITLTKKNFSFDDDGDVVMINAAGEPTGKNPDNFFKSDFKQSKPRFYSGSGKSGSGILPGANDTPTSYNGLLSKAMKEKNLAEIIKLKQNKLK